MSFLRTFFELEANRIVLNFAHGLIFFLMGFGILIKSKRWSDLTLAKSLPWLGLFGVVNALGDWGLVFLPIQGAVLSDEVIGVLWVMDTALLSLSYAFLLFFGARLLADSVPDLEWLPRLVPVLYGVWFAALVVSLVTGGVDPIAGLDTVRPFEIAYRYGFALTGSLLAAWSLFFQRDELRRLGLDASVQPLHWVGYSFLLHAVAAGLIVPEAGFFPANVVNDHAFFAATGIPVRLFTGMSGAIVTVLILVNLEVFDVELHRRIEDNRRMRAVLEERMRIARDLHDGIIQTLYALGLSLEGVMLTLDESKETAKKEIKDIMSSLNGAIRDVRGYIMKLKTPSQETSLDEQLQVLVRNLRRESRVPIRVKAEQVAAGVLSADAIGDVLLIIREAVSNALRHAKPSEIAITLVRDGKGINLSVTDDGIGFDPDSVRTGIAGEHQGLGNMRRRAEAVGGQLSIHSEPGEGTEVLLRIPLSAPSSD